MLRFILCSICLIGQNLQAAEIAVPQSCEVYFKYLSDQTEDFSPQRLNQILQISRDQKKLYSDAPSPLTELRNAITFVNNYTPPKDLDSKLSLTEHRAFVLKKLLGRLSEAYVSWRANLRLSQDGEYFFESAFGNYIKNKQKWHRHRWEILRRQFIVGADCI